MNAPVANAPWQCGASTFRMQVAVTAVLARDLFRKAPLTFQLTLCKGVYRAMFAKHFAAGWRRYLRRGRDERLALNGGATLPDEAAPSA